MNKPLTKEQYESPENQNRDNAIVGYKESAIDVFISQELERFDKEVISEKDLQKLVKKYSGLKVKDIDDKEGLNEVRRARIDLKNKVVEIKKKGKATRESANKFQKAIIERENILVDIIEPTKKELEAEEDRIAELKEQKRIEEEKRESDRIQSMLDKLNAVEAAIDFHMLTQMNESEFEQRLAEATQAFEEVKRKREEERIKEENDRKMIEAALKAEEQRQEKARLEQEAKEKALAEEQRKFKEEQERIAEANRKKEEELQAKEEKLAAEEAEKKRLQEIEDAKKAAAEKALKDKEEAERKAKEEEEEHKKYATEKEKFAMIAKEIETILNNSIWNTFKSKKGKGLARSIHNDLLEVYKSVTLLS